MGKVGMQNAEMQNCFKLIEHPASVIHESAVSYSAFIILH